jgi:putative DNA primase/helicase
MLMHVEQTHRECQIKGCQGALDSICHQYLLQRYEVPRRALNSSGVVDVALVKAALAFIPADDYAIWLKVGMALKAAGLTSDMWEEWSSKSEKWSDGECQKKWDSFKRSGITLGTVFHYAKQHGFQFPKRRYPLDDIGNAQRFVDQFGDVVRWYGAKRQWLVWDGRRWKPDNEEKVLGYAKEVARRIYNEAAECDDDSKRTRIVSHAKTTACAGKLDSMLKLSKPDLAVTAEMLDQDPLKFNCLNCTVDLRTGEQLPHNPADFITKLAGVAYNPDAQASRFMQFLNETFAGCETTIKYVQVVLGYCLTGDVSEQKLFICYGSGQNGKTTLLNAKRDVMGGYAQEADPALLIAKRNIGGATEDVARLRGTRFATTIETNEGVKLDEARVKQLTGGDMIVARHLYAHFEEFYPTHKLFIVTNHLPQIQTQSKAIWRRIVLIPFNVHVPDEKKDKHLPEKLRAEYEGILAWLVAGCREWQANGLPKAPAVVQATDEYKSDMDSLNRFIDACCTRSASGQVQSSKLRSRYVAWCRDSDEPELSTKAFANRMLEKGFVKRETNKGNFWCGLALRQEWEDLGF